MNKMYYCKICEKCMFDPRNTVIPFEVCGKKSHNIVRKELFDIDGKDNVLLNT